MPVKKQEKYNLNVQLQDLGIKHENENDFGDSWSDIFEQHSIFLEVFTEFGYIYYILLLLISLISYKKINSSICCLLLWFVGLNGLNEVFLYIGMAFFIRKGDAQQPGASQTTRLQGRADGQLVRREVADAPIESLKKLYYCPLKSNRLINESGERGDLPQGGLARLERRA